MREVGVFDLRLEIEGESREEVFARAEAAKMAVRDARLPGVTARYTQLRPPSRSRSVRATMRPAERKPRG